MDAIQGAIIEGDFDYVRSTLGSLIPIEPDVVNTLVDDEGTTLLHLAANCPAPSIMKLLLEGDADVDWHNSDGLTALHVAAMWGRKEIVLLLLDHGANPSIYDDDGMLPLDYARKEGHKPCVALLEQYLTYQDVKVDPDISVAEAFVSLCIANDDLQSSIDQYSITQQKHLMQDEVESKSQMKSGKNVHLANSPEGNSKGFLNCQSESELYATALDLSHDSTYTRGYTCTSNSTCDTVTCTVPEEIEKLSNTKLREELLALGEYPGPITKTTRRAYMLYLTKLRNGVQPLGNKGYKGFKYELSLVLNGTVPLYDLKPIEFHLTTPLITTKNSHRKRTKDCFNYLLLDPRVIHDLPTATVELDKFKVFVESVFYVGKGKNARSMQHLKEAKEAMMKAKKLSPKLECIINIWKEGHGILSLPVFHNMTEEESFSREACIIDAIGLPNLRNIREGHVHGAMCTWPRSKRRLFGVYLLYKAFKIYKLAIPQSLYPSDV